MSTRIALRRANNTVNDLLTLDYSETGVQPNSPGLLLNIVVPPVPVPPGVFTHWGSFRHTGQPVSALQSAFASFQPDEPGNHTVVLVVFENGRLVGLSGDRPIKIV